MDTITEAEPWLRGPLDGVQWHVMPAFFSFTQVREDLAKHTRGISDEEVWRLISGKHSLGFHLKHIAGSVDRLTTYLLDEQLSIQQLEFLQNEHTNDMGLAALLTLVDEKLVIAEQKLSQVKLDALAEARVVGRKRMPTTVMGLLVHLCEHTQRHLGQAILIAKLLNV